MFATGRGTPCLHHNVSKRMLRRAALGAGLDGGGRRVRFHDLRHTFASHLIIDIRLDVAQVSGMLGHARPSMTLDTYTHLFEQAAHGADVRAQLARSDFAMLLSRTLEPSLLSRERPRSTRATERPRAVRIVARSTINAVPAEPAPTQSALEQNLTTFVSATKTTDTADLQGFSWSVSGSNR